MWSDRTPKKPRQGMKGYVPKVHPRRVVADIHAEPARRSPEEILKEAHRRGRTDVTMAIVRSVLKLDD